MNLFFKKGMLAKREEGETLIRTVWSLYTGLADAPAIKRTNKGKPYFENCNIQFSISHSGDLWVCLVADFNVGVDIQLMKEGPLEAIADRFFSKDEAEAVRSNGKKEFYRIWTAREACGKYAGTGFMLPEKIDPYPVVKEVFISSDYYCMTAALKEETICITEIS